jgi:Glycogen recognition site of AMP-activated protein kinase
MNTMISLFIDNELRIEEKRPFIEKVRNDASFYHESLQMLHQELLIRSDVVDQVPRTDIGLPKSWWLLTIKELLHPRSLIPAAVVCAIVFLLILPINTTKPIFKNRFVVYRPDVSKVEIVGSFTDWKRIPLQKISNSGYWEAMFKLPEGEHRYTYILEDERPYTDPTVLTVEKDDFGGMNSIIQVEVKA